MEGLRGRTGGKFTVFIVNLGLGQADCSSDSFMCTFFGDSSTSLSFESSNLFSQIDTKFAHNTWI